MDPKSVGNRFRVDKEVEFFDIKDQFLWDFGMAALDRGIGVKGAALKRFIDHKVVLAARFLDHFSPSTIWIWKKWTIKKRKGLNRALMAKQMARGEAIQNGAAYGHRGSLL